MGAGDLAHSSSLSLVITQDEAGSHWSTRINTLPNGDGSFAQFSPIAHPTTFLFCLLITPSGLNILREISRKLGNRFNFNTGSYFNWIKISDRLSQLLYLESRYIHAPSRITVKSWWQIKNYHPDILLTGSRISIFIFQTCLNSESLVLHFFHTRTRYIFTILHFLGVFAKLIIFYP
jgi:hypothetical protein